MLTAKNIILKLIDARIKLKMTQQNIAEKMNTTASAISRLESIAKSDCNRKIFYSPTISTLVKYAEAVNCNIKIDILKNVNLL